MSCPHVLIADDDPRIRESLTFVLGDYGHELVEATTGTEVMDYLLLSPSPLLVLIYLLMPVMTGFDVLSHVATDHLLSGQHRNIVLSARPYPESHRDRTALHGPSAAPRHSLCRETVRY